MAFLQRYLITVGLLLSALLLAQPSLTAQPAKEIATFRIFALGPVDSLYYDLTPRMTKVVRLSTSNYSKSLPVPADGVINFYRLKPSTDPKLPPARIPVADVRVGIRTTPVIVVLVPRDVPGATATVSTVNPKAEFTYLILDDSPASHPDQTLRLVSFSTRATAVQFGPSAVELSPLQTKVLPYPSGDRTGLQLAVASSEGWQRIIGTTQMLAPKTKLTLFLSDVPPSPTDPNPIHLALNKIVEIDRTVP